MPTSTLQGFQLSPQQKRLWFLQQNDSVYLTQAAIAIEGDLQPAKLKKVVEQIIARHQILRTNFSRLSGVKLPVMTIGDRHSFGWEERKLNDCQLNLEELFKLARQQEYNLESDPILRLVLYQVAETSYILQITLPALCGDRWTLKNLFNEIVEGYSNYLDPSLKELQYVQFSEWQNQLLTDEDAETAQQFWQQQQLTSLTGLRLPGEHKSLKVSPLEIKTLELAIAPKLITQLETIAHKYQTSTELILLACWQILIWRLTEEPSIVIGFDCDRREYKEMHSIMGLLATWLPIRSNLTPDLTFTEVLELNNRTLESVQEWQDYFVPESVTDGDLAFPIGFGFEELPPRQEAEKVSFSLLKQSSCLEKFKLKLSGIDRHNSLLIEISYDFNYFSPDTITNIARQFQTLLEDAIQNPETRIDRLAILGSRDLQKLLCDFNQTQKDYPQDKCIHQLFEAQVEKTPEHLAIVFEEEQLTYAQLNHQANQLAHYLRQRGVKPEVLVGLYLEKSHLSIIGLLGILKAGGAYLPLDANLPTAALRDRLEATEIVLTQQKLVPTLPQSPREIICLDEDWEKIEKENNTNPVNTTTIENLAYVLFTSGSTGKPKGVAIEQQQILNYCLAISDRLNLKKNESFALVSSLAADLGNTAIFPALLTGGCLHIISPERATHPEAFADYCDRHSIDCLKIVPSHLNALLSAAEPEKILPKKCLILGGETLSWQLVHKIQQYQPNCQIFNHYGPTESTVGVCTFAITSETIASSSETVPLGKAIANTQIYLLDRNLQPVPIGVPGELYIGGIQISRGYFNRPHLTAERFIPNPFSDDAGSRLYRTGDKARYLPDGNIEFLGRIDHQVKLRGFRIELGEIESTLNQHPAIATSVVVLREDPSANQCLVAYITLEPEQTTEVSELRRHVESKLPNYMIPSAFVTLEALPLTPNGKIDRKALPAPDTNQPLAQNQYLAPVTPTQEILTLIWQEILAREPIGIGDNFFSLGGHSLIATRVVSQIRQIFKIELPLRSLFEKPTLADLAREIDLASQGNLRLENSTIQPISRAQAIPLSFAQQRLWFLTQLEPKNPFYNQPTALKLSGQLNIPVLQQSLEELVRRHEPLRTTFKTTAAGKTVQTINPAGEILLPIINLEQLNSATQAKEIHKLINTEAERVFNLEQDSLLRVSLLRLNSSEHIVLFTTHHIVSDEWSTKILVQEIATLYQAYLEGKPLPLPELPIQYADFAVWQREWLSGEVLANQLNYWHQQLQALPRLDLPTDYRRPAKTTHQGATLSFELSSSLTTGIKALAQKEGATLFMTLLAAFQVLLFRYSHQEDLVVGTPIANRNRAEIEGLIGFFVNTLVLRTNLEGNPSFSQLLQRVRQTTLEAYTHQDLPFEQLVEELKVERHLNRNPLFDVMFTLENDIKEELSLPGLTVNPLSEETNTALFDLTVSISETETGLAGAIEYSRELFKPSTIERMATHFQVLLEAIVTEPQQKVSQLPLLTAKEQQQLLVEWNDTEAEYPQDKCIHILFEEQVKKTPDAIAVVFGEQQLTYRELNQKANQLAHYLQQLGVKPEERVGICVERSLEMSIAILGVLKAGGAYVPLDPTYPCERITEILQDARVKILLTQQHLEISLPFAQTQLVYLERHWSELAQQSTHNCRSQATSENLAYVIYTSGSTGKPKGVAVTHQALVNYTLDIARQFSLQPGERVLQFASIGFDVAVEELFPTWLSGATVVVPAKIELLSCREFQQLIEIEQITVFELPTAYWHQWVSELSSCGESVPDCVRLVIVGGETISCERLRQWQQWQTPLIHVYGLTETTVTSTVYPLAVDAQPIGVGVDLPIGRGIANTQMYLLDSHLQPVPVGVAGEIYIGGEGLARGYLNRPHLTAERFIPNPFSDDAGSRLYRTGDKARYLPDGNIEYIGRIDYQVKLRGFRIELGEIESTLNQHPAVATSVVVLREDPSGNQCLVAYYIGARQLKFKQLRDFLKQKLPDYMIPSAFVELEAFPLTPNGKIDRKSLPVPDSIRPELEETFVAPRSFFEKAIAEIWSQVLNIDRVGIQDNFFDLGGHSLIATQVISRLRETFQVELPLRSIFESPTIAELAVAIVQSQLEQINGEEKAQFLAEIKDLSEEEIESMLAS